jgi:hypothetical protein
MRFDQLLHETVDEMTSQMKGPSAAFVDATMAQGRRIQRGRRVTVAGVALLACAAVAVPWVIISRPGSGPSAGPTPSPSILTYSARAGLTGGWVVTGAGNQVLDRPSQTYLVVEGDGLVRPAPVGDRVRIDGNNGLLQLTDPRGARPVTVDISGLGGDYRWSPTGDRLVGRANQKEPFKSGFAVIDANTGAVTKHWVDHDRYDCSDCAFSWTRDGREVVMAIADRRGGEGAEYVSSLQLFDATTGEPTRSLPVKAMPSSPFSWSPNGRYVIANPNVLANDWQLVDVTTGQSRPFPYDAVWVSDDQLLAPHNQTVMTLSPDGTVTAVAEVDIPGAGDLISLGPPT